MSRFQFMNGLREFLDRDAVPVKAITKNWITTGSPRHLSRTYEFHDFHTMNLFVIMILQEQEQAQHYASVSINFPVVSIELFTADLNDVTEIDRTLSRAFDSIFDEVINGGLDVTGPEQGIGKRRNTAFD